MSEADLDALTDATVSMEAQGWIPQSSCFKLKDRVPRQSI